jgi:hypothetical protein
MIHQLRIYEIFAHNKSAFHLLAWPDEQTKTAAWARFMADEEWKEIKRVTSAKHGDLVGGIEDRLLRPV